MNKAALAPRRSAWYPRTIARTQGNSAFWEKKVKRKILGIIAGATVCYFGFRALGLGLAELWPAYAVHVRTYRQQNLFTFPTLLAVTTVLLWLVAAFAAGFVAMKIARNWPTVKVLAAMIVAYAAVIHLILRWASFPWWYNIALVLLFGPTTLLGARSARSAP
jgi:hypothetical protein